MIRNEIDAGRPLAWRIGWSGGGGHFAVIEGYQRIRRRMGRRRRPVVRRVRPGGLDADRRPVPRIGSWTHTYFTRPGPIRAVMLDEIRLPWEIWERVRSRRGRDRRRRPEGR